MKRNIQNLVNLGKKVHIEVEQQDKERFVTAALAEGFTFDTDPTERGRFGIADEHSIHVFSCTWGGVMAFSASDTIINYGKWADGDANFYREPRHIPSLEERIDKIKELARQSHLYIYSVDEETGNQLMEDLENAGYRFGDGERPTVRGWAQLINVENNHTLCYPGLVGHMAFQSGRFVGDRKIIRLNYGALVEGADEPLM